MSSSSSGEPVRITVPTCIGCGAMAVAGTCESGCREDKLVLVRAAAVDTLTNLDLEARRSLEALLPVCEELIRDNPRSGPGADQVRAYARREHAQAALRRIRRPSQAAGEDVQEPAKPITVWSCSRCGGLDAPQPCLGICLWRPVEWVDQGSYESERSRVLPNLEAADRLRSLIHRLAFVTPRPGAQERSLRAFRAEAERLMATPPSPGHAR